MYSEPRKKVPNMPAPPATWMRLAPVTLRERKIPIGTSGLAAVSSRSTNSASSTSDAPPSARVADAVQPWTAAWPTIV